MPCPPTCASCEHGYPEIAASVVDGGLQLTELKSDKSRRTIALPAQLAAALNAHRAGQLQERINAGPAWQGGNYVWCQEDGRPIGAHADWAEWRELLKTADVRQVRVHDARHTAAALLRAQRVDQSRGVAGLM